MCVEELSGNGFFYYFTELLIFLESCNASKLPLKPTSKHRSCYVMLLPGLHNSGVYIFSEKMDPAESEAYAKRLKEELKEIDKKAKRGEL